MVAMAGQYTICPEPCLFTWIIRRMFVQGYTEIKVIFPGEKWGKCSSTILLQKSLVLFLRWDVHSFLTYSSFILDSWVSCLPRQQLSLLFLRMVWARAADASLALAASLGSPSCKSHSWPQSILPIVFGTFETYSPAGPLTVGFLLGWTSPSFPDAAV